MIRIDEIYNNTFWPWLQKNKPGTRLFFCDPPGNTDPDALLTYRSSSHEENNYVYFHDQEPVWIDEYKPLYKSVLDRNGDLVWEKYASHLRGPTDLWGFPLAPVGKTNPLGHIIVSEKGENVERVCNEHGWKNHYYFYHGWACQDWYRGYDKSFLIPRASDRRPTKTFMSPNRIVGGKRDHRVLFLYNVFKKQLTNNHISAPRMCDVEKIDISLIGNKYCNIYPDIRQVLEQAHLPRLFKGEDSQQMTSCWLTNFTEAQDSLVYVPTETLYFGRRTHITEKTFKAIALEMPFVLVAPAYSLEYMRSYGFKTFDGIFDESYDNETDDIQRIEKVTQLLKDMDNLSVRERQEIHRACLPIVEHNFNHFYRGGFSDILWTELNNMLKGLADELST